MNMYKNDMVGHSLMKRKCKEFYGEKLKQNWHLEGKKPLWSWKARELDTRNGNN